MGSLFTLILSGMFAAMSYQGSMFNRPELFVVAIFASIAQQIVIGHYFDGAHWLVLALSGYLTGLLASIVFDRARGIASGTR